MKEEFKKFSENIRLTSNQETDAKTKYDGVCETLHKQYYGTKYDGKTKLLFGSYKTKTNTRPFDEKQDVDVIFKIPQATFDQYNVYSGNGQSALLQEIRNHLTKTYSTSEQPKAWGKVVLVKFADNHHNVEVLPALEKPDGTFLIPNTENGGSWESFDPKSQLDSFYKSNNDTNGLTADLARMLKTWVKNTSSLTFKSYELLNLIIEFLKSNYQGGTDYDNYNKLIRDTFQYLKLNCDRRIVSYVESAFNRAQKAFDYSEEGKPKEASEEYKKIFGNEFPLVKENPVKESKTRVFSSPSSPYAKL